MQIRTYNEHFLQSGSGLRRFPAPHWNITGTNLASSEVSYSKRYPTYRILQQVSTVRRHSDPFNQRLTLSWGSVQNLALGMVRNDFGIGSGNGNDFGVSLKDVLAGLYL